MILYLFGRFKHFVFMSSVSVPFSWFVSSSASWSNCYINLQHIWQNTLICIISWASKQQQNIIIIFIITLVVGLVSLILFVLLLKCVYIWFYYIAYYLNCVELVSCFLLFYTAHAFETILFFVFCFYCTESAVGIRHSEINAIIRLRQQ